MTVLLVILIILLPVFVTLLTTKVTFFKKIDGILLCYIFGFICSIFINSKYKIVSQEVSSIIVVIAIPLILFSFNIFDFKKLVKSTVIAFLLMIVSVMLVSTVVGIVAYKNGLNYALQLSGMTTGLYIGGTPNMFAIGNALLKDATIINIANISDSLIGGIYIIIIMAFGKKIYGILPKKEKDVIKNDNQERKEDFDFSFIKDKRKTKKLLLSILLALLCVGVGILLELLVNGNLQGSLFIILTVSILGIIFGTIPSIRNIEGSYQVGQYLIMMFSFALSLSIDFNTLALNMIPVFIFFICVQLLSAILHFVLCALFKIDGGTALITSIAGIYGPPFIAPVAKAYGDDNLIMPGVICGAFGLAVGNLLGIGLSSLLLLIV